MSEHAPHHEATRERILDAAERLFAEHGFAPTSVREITALADCNVAAVNYHFGGKESLYLETFRRLLTQLREHRLGRMRRDLDEADDPATLETFLASFAGGFLGPLVEQGRGRRLMALFDREMLDPHLPPQTIAEEMIEPIFGAALQVLTRLAPGISTPTAWLCMVSVVGQLIHSMKVCELDESRRPGGRIPTDLAAHVDHIVRFSAAGIRAAAPAPEPETAA